MINLENARANNVWTFWAWMLLRLSASINCIKLKPRGNKTSKKLIKYPKKWDTSILSNNCHSETQGKPHKPIKHPKPNS